MATIVNPLPVRDVLQDHSRDYLLYADQILNSLLPGYGKTGAREFASPFPYTAPESFNQWVPLMEREQIRQLRLCVKVPALGSFYLFADSPKRIADLIPNIELKVYELYRTFICVHKLQTEENMDLPLGCSVGSILQDHSIVSVLYTRTAESFTDNTTFSPTYYPQEFPTHTEAVHETRRGSNGRMGVKFRDAPPTKVIQNKEFSFSVSAKSLPPCDDADAFSPEHLRYDNVWGAPVPLPRGDDVKDEVIPICSGDRGDVPYDIVVEEEGGGILHARDFSVRSSVLDKKRGLFVFFVKIKKNSHYGRTRFIVKVKDRRIKKRAAKDTRDHNGGSDQLEGLWARELLASAPIVVVSKERKATKRKKNKEASTDKNNNNNNDTNDANNNVTTPPGGAVSL